MIGRFFSTVRAVGHVCSEFGMYMMRLQGRCLTRGRNGDCEGGPRMEEARRDWIALSHSKSPVLPYMGQ